MGETNINKLFAESLDVQFSNLKILDLGLCVSILTTHGIWSYVDLAKGVTTVFG